MGLLFDTVSEVAFPQESTEIAKNASGIPQSIPNVARASSN
jgi:hypothetical protein